MGSSGFIQGPVLRFSIDAPGLAAAITPAMDQAKAQATQASRAIASEWQRMAAQMRTSLSYENLSLKEQQQMRQQILRSIDGELSLLRTRDSLTTKELANLKAMTLERERQLDAIKRGQNIGITGGTASALGYGASQVSTQASLGIERMLDSLVNRYFGGAAGALTRTVRDVGYYSSVGSAGVSGSGGIFGNITGGLSTLLSAIPETTLAVGGLATAFVALGAGSVAVTLKMMDAAQAINNMAATTGLSTKQVQEYNVLADQMGIDAGGIANAFARLQAQIGEYVTKGKAADQSTQAFVKVLNSLGVSIKDDVSGNIRNINDIIGDFADVVKQIPDANKQAALTMEALGVRGKILADAMRQATLEGVSFKDMLDKIGVSDKIISQGEIDRFQDAKNRIDQLHLSFSGFVEDIRKAIADGTLEFLSPLLNISIPEWLSPRLNGLSTDRNQTRKGIAPGVTDLSQVPDALRNALNQPVKPGEQLIVATKDTDVQATNKALLDQAAIIKDGSAAEAERLLAELRYQDAVKSGSAFFAKMYAEEVAAAKAKLSAEAAEKGYQEAVKDNNGILAKQYAGQVASAKALADEDQKRIDLAKKFLDSVNAASNARPTFRDTTREYALQKVEGLKAQQEADIQKLIGTGITPVGPTLSTVLTGPMNTVIDNSQEIEDAIKRVNKTWKLDTQTTAQDIEDAYQEEFMAFKVLQEEHPKYAQQISDALVEVKEDELQKIRNIYKSESDALFESLVSGKTKEAGKELEKDLENILLAPLKKQFENVMGSLFAGLDQAVNGTGAGGGYYGSTANSSGIAGSVSSGGGAASNFITKIFGRVFGSPNAPGGTAGTFAGSLGIAKSGAGPLPGQFSTPAMYVQAQVVNIGGAVGAGPGTGAAETVAGLPLNFSVFGGGTGAGPAGTVGGLGAAPTVNLPGIGPVNLSQVSSTLGGIQLGQGFSSTTAFGGIPGLPGVVPTSSTGAPTPDFISKALNSPYGQALSGAAPGLLLAGLGFSHGNTSAEATGTAAVASSLAKSLGSAGVISSKFADQLGQGFGGAGMLAGGILQGGGLSGTLTDVAGGAELGSAILPGIGTAIGAAVGGLIGGIQSIFGMGSWQNRVRRDMNNQSVFLPPSENFSFASNGSIGSTLGTGFAQSGNSLYQYGTNQAFTASAIYGPLTAQQKLQLQQTELGMNANTPFLGQVGTANPATNPFTNGGQIPGYAHYPQAPPPM